ncbi:unnamed protein product, partial [Boreogadus saida]
MKRSYESGSHKKKKKDQRQDFLSKLPKLSSFFTATAVAAGPSEDQVNVVCCHVTAPFIPSGSGSASSDANDVCQQTDGDDAQLVVNISHSPSSTSVIEIDDNNDNNDCETHIL